MAMLDMAPIPAGGWRPPIVKIGNAFDPVEFEKGLEELATKILDHREYLINHNLLGDRMRRKRTHELNEALREAILEPVLNILVSSGELDRMLDELLRVVATIPVGRKVDVKVLRDGKAYVIPVVVTERKETTQLAEKSGGAGGYFGMTVGEITPEVAQNLGLSEKKGVVVVRVKPGSPADEAGVRPRDVIVQVNKVKISSIKDYKREMSRRMSEIRHCSSSREAKQTFTSLSRRVDWSKKGRKPPVCCGRCMTDWSAVSETSAGGRLKRLLKSSSARS